MNPKLIEQMGNAMGDVYAAVVNEILVNMAKHFPYIDDSDTAFSVWQYQTTKLGELGQIRRETLDILVNMLGGADAVLRSYLQNAILDGVRDADKPIQDAAKAGLLPSGWRIPPEVSPEQTQAFKAFYRQSADKLNLVNTVMLESTQQAYQSTVSDIVSRMQRTQTILNTQTGKVVTGVTALNQAMRDGVKQMVQNGITGFIDHAGRRWTPEAYVTMDIRTTLANTARAAVFERSEETGNDLYQVSYHDGARPLCYPWQGKVISRQDLSREVTDRDGNTVHVYAQSETTYGEAAGLFGINCGHYPIPFVPGFSKIRPPEQDAEENAKEYEQSQQQRALERNLRNEKRDLAVLKAQGATKEEIAAQRERVRAASAKLDAFSDETGRARRRGREGVPIQATFPNKADYDAALFDDTKQQEMRTFFKNNARPVQIQQPEAPEKRTPIQEPSKAEATIENDSQEAKNRRVVQQLEATEQPLLAGYKKYNPETRTLQEKMQQVNPHYSEGRQWQNNCQRTVVAQELVLRGYDVTAMPYDSKDRIKDSGVVCWKFNNSVWYKDSELSVVPKRTDFKQTVQQSFEKWGEGSRAIVRVKWARKYGGNGHFINAIYENGQIKYVDPQIGKERDIDDTLSKCTTGRNQMWIMRVDNRDLTENVKYAVKNVGDD